MSLTKNYFEVFNLTIAFEIDINILTKCYQDLQRTVHPDKYANASDQERRLAMQKTTQINEAFQTLKDPLKRGLYLLQLRHIDTNISIMDNNFLMQQIELHEELATFRQQANPLEKLQHFLDRIEQYKKQIINTLNQTFTQQDYDSAHSGVQKLQFFSRLNEEALRLEEELI
ncbi:MAG: Fe-S protein assembly co-chaperone HscB [Thiomargarita sp.]|nr:Fe-S protein assembly co-chaperone HscB [Thiomargarita sp.]